MAQIQQNGFLSHNIYQNLIPKDHPFRLIQKWINFEQVTVDEDLFQMYKNKFGGNENWAIPTMLKVLFVQRMYNTSDRQTEELITQNVFVKFFIGIEIQAKSPDHTVITKFRNRLLALKGKSFFERLFNNTNKAIIDSGIKLGGSYFVDS